MYFIEQAIAEAIIWAVSAPMSHILGVIFVGMVVVGLLIRRWKNHYVFMARH